MFCLKPKSLQRKSSKPTKETLPKKNEKFHRVIEISQSLTNLATKEELNQLLPIIQAAQTDFDNNIHLIVNQPIDRILFNKIRASIEFHHQKLNRYNRILFDRQPVSSTESDKQELLSMLTLVKSQTEDKRKIKKLEEISASINSTQTMLEEDFTDFFDQIMNVKLS